MDNEDVKYLDQEIFDVLNEVLLLHNSNTSHGYLSITQRTISTEDVDDTTEVSFKCNKQSLYPNDMILLVQPKNINFLQFPSLFISGLNSGDINILCSLFLNYLDSNCLFRTPRVNNEALNIQRFLEVLNQRFEAVPDSIVYLKKVDVLKKHSKYTLLNCKTYGCGTNNYHYYRTSRGNNRSLVDSMNLSKFTEEEIVNLRRQEEIIIQTTQLVEVFSKINEILCGQSNHKNTGLRTHIRSQIVSLSEFRYGN